MAKILISKKNKNSKINHLSLRFSMEQGSLIGLYIVSEGKISKEPETWSIRSQDADKNIIDTFLYTSKKEYNEDLNILGL